MSDGKVHVQSESKLEIKAGSVQLGSDGQCKTQI